MTGYYSLTELLDRGWTRAAITKFLGKDEDETRPNPHYRHAGAPMRFWRETRVHDAETTPGFRAWKARLDARRSGETISQANMRMERRYERKYASFRDALPDACEALFELNRYAKHQSCTTTNQQEIYRLKNGLIRLLYEQGFATECYEHHLRLEAKPCWACDSTGKFWNGDDCQKCDGTGDYLPARTVRFVVFKFGVAGKTYSWHQPKELVSFSYRKTIEGSQPLPAGVSTEKPVDLDSRERTAAKRLIAWVIERAPSVMGAAA